MTVVVKPTPDHFCCDVCVNNCKCEECILLVTSDEVESSLVAVPSYRHNLSSFQRQQLKNKIEMYRQSLISKENALFDEETRSGIPDCVVQLIMDIFSLTENDVCNYGLPLEYATAIHHIIQTFINK